VNEKNHRRRSPTCLLTERMPSGRVAQPRQSRKFSVSCRERSHEEGSGISASLGAILGSLATMVCCLPFPFASALGAAGARAFLLKFRPWFLGLSILLLGNGILAATPRSAMRREGQDLGTSVALDHRWHCRGNDFVPTAECGIHCGPAIRTMKMKSRTLILAVLAAFLLFVGLCLWGPSKTPSF
jgi:hypothetical protein